MNEPIVQMTMGLLHSVVSTVNTALTQGMQSQATMMTAGTQGADTQRILQEVQRWLNDFTQRIERVL